MVHERSTVWVTRLSRQMPTVRSHGVEREYQVHIRYEDYLGGTLLLTHLSWEHIYLGLGVTKQYRYFARPGVFAFLRWLVRRTKQVYEQYSGLIIIIVQSRWIQSF